MIMHSNNDSIQFTATATEVELHAGEVSREAWLPEVQLERTHTCPLAASKRLCSAESTKTQKSLAPRQDTHCLRTQIQHVGRDPE